MGKIFKIKRGFYLTALLFSFIIVQLLSNNFDVNETFIVFLYLAITSISKNFKINKSNIFAPQNIAFIIFFTRLYILPLLGVFYGYKNFIDINNIDTDLIFRSYIITLVMYLAFIIGWEINCSKQRNNYEVIYQLNNHKIKWTIFFFAAIGCITIINIFSDFQGYISTVYLNKTDDISIVNGNKYVSFLLGMSKYFLPFVVFSILTLIDIKTKSKIGKYWILSVAVLIVLILSLNSNRQSMIYPILALIVGFSRYIKFKTVPVLILSLISLYLVFNFSNLRDVNSTSSNNLKHTEEIIKDVQIYAGGAQIITPVFKHKEFKFTIFNSFISSFPILGTPYREESGTILYNYLFYDSYGIVDQVFLTQAECYLNGGHFLVFIFFIIVGFYYSKLNILFYRTFNSQFLFVVTLYYFILLFNSTILLSFQVMGQFLFYNSLPALILFKLYKKDNKEKIYVLKINKIK